MTTPLQKAYFIYLDQVTTEISMEQFEKLLLSDDDFNIEWSNGCTKELTFDERYQIAQIKESVKLSKVQKNYGEAYVTMALNDFKIPKRKIIF